MALYIRIKDGQPFGHPFFDWNMQDTVPGIDLNNLPLDWAEFIRVPIPDITIGVYEVAEVSYQWRGDKVYDVWSSRPMTAEEKAAMDEKLKITNGG